MVILRVTMFNREKDGQLRDRTKRCPGGGDGKNIRGVTVKGGVPLV